ncbi:PREDICTED: 4-coumarate--CoA ligase-like 9 [Tarenaya hassleriana]|uniref:4-coumarate--CoA ligase-like 9 n=1 Tax=Tarenaya hassleriana TaxID=28532 RepID=UPI00053C77D7|nr:PREDICTED: 4-coumarate--CoA ligase-like 9 [Tarenaya hassleriana]
MISGRTPRMAPPEDDDSHLIDRSSGFDRRTGIYHSLRGPLPLHPLDQPLSAAEHALSLLRRSSPVSTAGKDIGSITFIVNATTGESITYAELLHGARSLAVCLRERFPSLSQNDVAFILSPASTRVPVLYFALMSIGIVISPANPVGSNSEVSHQVRISKPAIAFATSQTVQKLRSSSFPLGIVLIDSPEFLSWLTRSSPDPVAVRVNQSDPALFHVFGFAMLVRAMSLGDTLVLLERFDFEAMLKAVEKYKVTGMSVSPPLIVALIKSELTKKYDIRSLRSLGCGGAPLGKDVAEKFKEKFPDVEIIQGYGLTESSGPASSTFGPEETVRYGSVGRISENLEGKIVDPVTGKALPPNQKGELWLRGPIVMKGYAGDEKATEETIDREGWLKTGDLCYFDSEGFLYIVDRLKELIKYKAYQVPPVELEQILQSHPEVVDAAVVPYPDEDAGEIPMAFIVRKPGSNISEEQIIEFVARQVAPYKKIRRVAFTNAIPKNPAGKILRRELTKLAVAGNSSKL